VSGIALVEVPAALWRKERTGELDPGDAGLLSWDFAVDFAGTRQEEPRFSVVSVTDLLLEDAARLVAVRGLRAYDAVQLATAVTAREVDPDCRSFACFDRKLRTAAAAHNFALVPA
jgi:predicted nucleic acid-binding protein